MPMSEIESKQTSLLAWMVLPLAALVALVPLFRLGCSCGHDIGFHLQSWLEAAHQLRAGTVYPSWAFSPGFNAGEPRFLFYPPLSWVLGEWLTMVLPFRYVPEVYTWVVLSCAGLSMYAVAKRLTLSEPAALLAGALYLANPYMLFTALERTAYAELLATVFLPWVILGALKARPSAVGVAVPLALLWLTNAPAAVMGSYLLLVLVAVRVAVGLRAKANVWPLLGRFVGGTILGMLLPGFYLVPAIYEQRFVQITMVLVPGLSVPNNFLFLHNGDGGHDFVNGQVSRIAVGLLVAMLVGVVFAVLANRRVMLQAHEEKRQVTAFTALLAFGCVMLVVAFLLVRPSLVLWMHLPEMAFLQFPWRLLMVMAGVLGLTLALGFAQVKMSAPVAVAAGLACVAALSFSLDRHYLYKCDEDEKPGIVARLFRTSHGVSATDEYTPKGADNDVLRFGDPGYWLTTDPQAFVPWTTPNPNAAEPDKDFGQPPPEETLSEQAPHHLVVDLPQAETLVLNLRDFHNWLVTRNGNEVPAHIQRDDGLIAIALPAGPSTIDVHWRSSADRYLGGVVSFVGLNILLFCIFGSRRIVL